MARRVGIPRAMGYYYGYPFFRTLLLELGARPVVSPPTTARVLGHMESCPTDEPCLAVKLHFAHADTLVQRGDVDLLLLPVIAHVGGVPCCPKFAGVAEMIRHGLRLPADYVLMPVVDLAGDDRTLLRALTPLTARLGVHDRRVLTTAITRAREAQQMVRGLCVSHHLTIPDAYSVFEHGVHGYTPTPAIAGPRTAVIGHPYLIYEAISLGMVERLRQYGPVVTAEMIDQTTIDKALADIPDGARLWPFEAMLVGAALHLLRTRAVEKMILAGAFECGPESIIETYLEGEAQRQGIPLMTLTLDEHTGEAGLVTRLEAFMDTEKTAPPPAAPPTHGLARRERVLGLPSMGYLDTAIRTIFTQCGTTMLPTPRALSACVELGRESAPEFICFPFTATLGQLRTLLDQGATTLLMVGGKGFCRLGWYAQVQETLLRNLGYEFEMIVIDSPFPWREKGAAFRHALRTAAGHASWPRMIDAIRTGWQQLTQMERADTLAHRLRAFERVPGTTNRLLDRYLHRMAALRDRRAMRRLERDFLAETAAVETEETHPVRVRLVGEIWVVLESAATRDVERWLGGRDHPRVWVERELSVSSWFSGHVLASHQARRREAQILEAARPWLNQPVGGHGQETIGLTALARSEGMDGVLHVFPFTCMPEIIAQNIMVRLAEECDITVLTYIVSEQTGEAGMETRLESFLDLLEERRGTGERDMHGTISRH